MRDAHSIDAFAIQYLSPVTNRAIPVQARQVTGRHTPNTRRCTRRLVQARYLIAQGSKSPMFQLTLRTAHHLRGIIVTLLIVGHGATAHAQPKGGDVFREYRWTNTGGDAGGSLRVGGRVGYDGNPVTLPQKFDLKDAIRAEVVIEKLLCHAGTRGLESPSTANPGLQCRKAVRSPNLNWTTNIIPIRRYPYRWGSCTTVSKISSVYESMTSTHGIGHNTSSMASISVSTTIPHRNHIRLVNSFHRNPTARSA